MWCYKIYKVLRDGETQAEAEERFRAYPAFVAFEPAGQSPELVSMPGVAGKLYLRATDVEDDRDDEAQLVLADILINNPQALPGSARLVWFDGRGGALVEHLREDVPTIDRLIKAAGADRVRSVESVLSEVIGAVSRHRAASEAS